MSMKTTLCVHFSMVQAIFAGDQYMLSDSLQYHQK